MIWTCLKIACTVMIFDFMADWFRGLTEPSDYFDYCYNCKAGFCMEIPESEGCKKWREKKA
ncbi:MAG: hypothetical protein J6U54_11275 [Clostridiales bacterium]|nr:hypothetical protein [Clostridiales bacterium]